MIIASGLGIYAVTAAYIYKKNLFEDHITFFGPVMLIRTSRVSFFDIFTRFSTFLRLYGTLGVTMVVGVSATMVGMLFITLQYTIVTQPEPGAIYQLPNILVIPGVNQFIPFTFAVWFAFVTTLIIHETGHAALCRVEGIGLKSIGVILAAIPIGAFVEPEEEDVENAGGMRKARMLGAGITNNIVAGVICFAVMVLLLGMAVPTATPYIYGVYEDCPAYAAGVPVNSVITAVNGISVGSIEDVAGILEETRPGDIITISVEEGGEVTEYGIVVTQWPEELGVHDSGFMGVYYYDAGRVKTVFDRLGTPLGAMYLMNTPFADILYRDSTLSIIKMNVPETAIWDVPFRHFWEIIQILFWCGWFNIAVGTFNAIPMIPLDGGYIMKEGVERLFKWRGWSRYATYVVASVTWLMLFMIVSIVALPHLLHL